MRPNAREVQEQADAAKRTPDEPGRFLDLDVTAALRTGDPHDADRAIASLSVMKNFIPGRRVALHRPQAIVVLRLTPLARQKLARAVTLA
jgi:hypothetical protein